MNCVHVFVWYGRGFRAPLHPDPRRCTSKKQETSPALNKLLDNTFIVHFLFLFWGGGGGGGAPKKFF